MVLVSYQYQAHWCSHPHITHSQFQLVSQITLTLSFLSRSIQAYAHTNSFTIISYLKVKNFFMNADGSLNKQPAPIAQMVLDARILQDPKLGNHTWKHRLLGCTKDPITCQCLSAEHISDP
jgi:hypothetical protein